MTVALKFEIVSVAGDTEYEAQIAYVAKDALKKNLIRSGFRALTNATTGHTIANDTNNVNGVPSSTITGDLTTLGDNLAAVQDSIDDLETIYGDTVSAAASAAAAATSAADAAAQAVLAGSAKTAADAAAAAAAASFTAADAARVLAAAAQADAVAKALAAAGSATAAAGSATSASSSATSASGSAGSAASSASAASASATAASTSAGNALVSANNAATSATSASGSASAASSSATTAAGSATAAGGSATAASGSATAAATSATNAGNSATSAASSSVSAQSVANRLIPDRPSAAIDFLESPSAGDPDTAAALTSGTVASVTNEGSVREFTTNIIVFTRGGLTVVAGHTYRMETRTRVTVDGTANLFYYGFQVLDASWANVGSSLTSVNVSQAVADGWQSFSLDQTATQILTAYPTAAYVRARVYGGRNAGATASGATWQLAYDRLRDVTSEAAAAGYATAAATSASSASTSASGASTSASSASTSATAAATSATAASNSAASANTYATNASNSASTATTQASNASTSAGAAAGSATAAGGSATAAAGSATTASTAATNAGNSATSAAASAVSAQSVATRLLPERPSFGSDFTSTAIGGAPDVTPAVTVGTVVTVTGEGDVRQYTTGQVTYTRGAFILETGKTFRLQYRTRVTVNSTPNVNQSSWQVYDSTWTRLGDISQNNDDTSAVVADGWQNYSRDITTATVLALYSTGVYIRASVGIGITSAGASSGATTQLAYLRFSDVTSEAAALVSANAASTSASSAMTQAGLAGTSAGAASTSATNAGTQAGYALISANNAATSESNALGYSGTASTYAGNASTSATNAGTSASNAGISATTASNAASAAATSATLSASIGGSFYNKNPVFSTYSTTPGVPDLWSDWSNGTTACTRLAGTANSPYQLQISSGAGINAGILQSVLGKVSPGWNVIECAAEVAGGTWAGAAVYLQISDGTHDSSALLTLATDPTIENTTATVTGNRIFQWAKLVYIDPTYASAWNFAAVYAMGHWSGAGSIAVANIIRFTRVGARPALAGEVETGVARAGQSTLSAKLTDIAAVAASATGVVASRATILEAKAIINQNLIDGGFINGTTGVSPSSTNVAALAVGDDPVWGRYLAHFTAGGFTTRWDINFGGNVATQTFTLSADMLVNMASGTGSVSLNVSWRDSSDGFIIDDTAMTIAATASRPWTNSTRFSQTYTAPTGAYRARIRWITTTGTGVPNPVAIRQLKFERGSVATPFTNEPGASTLAGRVTTTETVALDGQSKANAMYSIDVSTGTSKAGFVIASGTTSYFDIWADYFRVWDGTGRQQIFTTQGTDITFKGAVYSDKGIYIGTSSVKWPLGLARKKFTVSDGDTIAWGYTLPALPDIDYTTMGLKPISATQIYSIYPTSLSTTGATIAVKIITPGTSVAYTVTPDAGSFNVAGGANAGRYINLGSHGDADGLSYLLNLSAGGSYTIAGATTAPGGSGIQVLVTYRIYFYYYNGSAWVYHHYQDAQYLDIWTTNGSKTPSGIPVPNTSTYPPGTGAQYLAAEVVSILNVVSKDAVTGAAWGSATGTIMKINAITNCKFTVTPPGTTTSATPNGEKCIIAIVPNN